MVYFDQILHTYTCQQYRTTGMCNNIFLMSEGSLSIDSASCDQLVKMLMTLEPHGIVGSNFAYLFILTFSSYWYANGDEALPRIILVKRLITLEPAPYILIKFCILLHFLKLTGKNDKEKKVRAVSEPLYVWLLDYKKAS